MHGIFNPARSGERVFCHRRPILGLLAVEESAVCPGWLAGGPFRCSGSTARIPGKRQHRELTCAEEFDLSEFQIKNRESRVPVLRCVVRGSDIAGRHV